MRVVDLGVEGGRELARVLHCEYFGLLVQSCGFDADAVCDLCVGNR